MAVIIQRDFSGGTSKGIALGYVSGSNDASMTRTVAVGTNWSVIRMGLLCGIKAGVSQSYHRNYGLCLGFCSGSNTDLATSSNVKTWAGAMFGSYIYTTPYTNTYWFWHFTDVTSGSYFGIDTCWIGGSSSGVEDTNSSVNLSSNTGNFYFANNATVPFRRLPIILEISASSATNLVIKVNCATGSLENIDYTSDQLLAALTGSGGNGITGSNGARTLATKIITNITHNRSTYPLDTAFVDWAGGGQFEIYDWYIYKVR